MTLVVLILFYFSLSLWVGYLGRNTQMGWQGWTMVSIFFTPFVGYILHVLTDPNLKKK